MVKIINQKIRQKAEIAPAFIMMKSIGSGPGKKIAAGLQSLMALIYMGCGVFLFYSEKGKLLMPSEILPYTSAALLIYGLFRGFRAWNQIRNAGIRIL